MAAFGSTREMLQLVKRDKSVKQTGGNIGAHGLILNYDQLIVIFHFTKLSPNTIIIALRMYAGIRTSAYPGAFMKRIRIGSGAGYSGDRIEPAVELAEKGGIDYLIF